MNRAILYISIIVFALLLSENCCAQKLSWLTNGSYGPPPLFTSMKYDKQGNIYTVVAFRDSLVFQGKTILKDKRKSGVKDQNICALLKFSSAKKLQWIKKIKSSESGGIYITNRNLFIDDNENIYLSISFRRGFTLDSINPSVPKTSNCLIKFNPNGKIKWTSLTGNDSTTNGTFHTLGLIGDHKGYVFMYGTFKDSINIGGFILKNATKASAAFVTKYDTSGNIIQAFKVNDDCQRVNDCKIMPNGNILITGYRLTKNAEIEYFLSCFDTNFGLLWENHYLSKGYSSTISSCSNNDSFIFFACNFKDEISTKNTTLYSNGNASIYISKCTLNNKYISELQIDNNVFTTLLDMNLSKLGTLYISVASSNRIVLGQDTFGQSNLNNDFIIGLTKDLKYDWSWVGVCAEFTRINSFDVDSVDNIVFTGRYRKEFKTNDTSLNFIADDYMFGEVFPPKYIEYTKPSCLGSNVEIGLNKYAQNMDSIVWDLKTSKSTLHFKSAKINYLSNQEEEIDVLASAYSKNKKLSIFQKIQIYNSPNIDLGKDTVLCGVNNLMINITDKGYRYLWNTGNVSPTLNITKSGKYWLMADNKGCVQSDTINIKFNNLPKYSRFNYEICEADSNPIFIKRDQNLSGFWLPEMNSNIEKKINKAGVYFYKIIAAGNCTFIDSVVVDKVCNYPIYIPNCFTPNGDNLNDTFSPNISLSNIESYYFSIFNLWGQNVFSTNKPQQGWDGVYEGFKVQDGNYLWLLRYKLKGNSEEYRKGYLQIIR
ncbi:MAG: gliding motility-associated C-terminal domain-containing protein [Bacteroidetes bacterium]|nr:gliding motility-associated C-terminal domain-containing protein [Bacteroidota bacterium]